jgi:hypothetical protein
MSDQKESNRLAWGQMVLVPIVLALIGSDAWQYWKTPEKIVEVTHRKEQIEEDSIRTQKIAEKVLDQLTEQKLAGLLISRGIQQQFNLDDEETIKLEQIVREVLDSNDVYNFRNRLALKNRKQLDAMFGYGILKNGERFFVSPDMQHQKIFFSIPEGRKWVESGFWRLDQNGVAQSIPSYKNIKLK